MSIIIQPESGFSFPPIEREPGQVATFGRGHPDFPVDVPLPDPAVSRLAGEIVAADDYWRLTNLSPNKTYVIENPEGGGEFIKVTPRRIGAPIPFEFSRVVLPGQDTKPSFLVFAPEHNYPDELTSTPPGDTTAGYSLDKESKYFLVLVALCEPRLRDPASPVIPTVPDLEKRLEEHGIGGAAIRFHIDYLATRKLRVKDAGDPGRAIWQRAAMVNLALRFDLVREEHLRLLPSPG